MLDASRTELHLRQHTHAHSCNKHPMHVPGSSIVQSERQLHEAATARYMQHRNQLLRSTFPQCNRLTPMILKSRPNPCRSTETQTQPQQQQRKGCCKSERRGMTQHAPGAVAVCRQPCLCLPPATTQPHPTTSPCMPVPAASHRSPWHSAAYLAV
jgi:hypothetical protein